MFNPVSDTYRYVKNNMMLVKDESVGDSLWRTSLSYIAYNNDILKNGILSCFRKFKMTNRKKYLYQGCRYFNRYGEDDVSRDQVILALSSLKVNNNITELKEISTHLPFRLSRRFIMGPTMWIWVKSITSNKKFYTYLFGLLELIEFLPSVLLTKFIRRIMGWNKEYSQEWYCGYDINMDFWTFENNKWIWVKGKDYPWVNNSQKLYSSHQKKKDENWLYKAFGKVEYPEYALHLTSWLVYVSNNSILKRILQKLGIWLAEKDNLLIRLLMGDDVNFEDINKYKPVNHFRWSSRFNGTSYCYYLEYQDAIYNIIDKDILLTIKNIQK